MNIEITKQYQRSVDFSALIDAEEGIDGPQQTALINLPVGLDVQKWVGMGEDTAILVADTEDEVEEKVSELIMQFQIMSKCIKYLSSGEIKGVDFNNAAEYASHQHKNVVAWGGKSNFTTISAVLEREFPDHLTITEDEDDDIGEPLVYFYWTKDVHLDKNGEFNDIYAEDYPLNPKAKELGINNDCYGEIVQLPLSVAQQYFQIEWE